MKARGGRFFTGGVLLVFPVRRKTDKSVQTQNRINWWFYSFGTCALLTTNAQRLNECNTASKQAETSVFWLLIFIGNQFKMPGR